MTSMSSTLRQSIFILIKVGVLILVINTVDCIVVNKNETLNRLIRASNGNPVLGNCYPSKSIAQKNYYLIKNALMLEPSWTNIDPSSTALPEYEKYYWKYTATRETLEKTSENYDLSKHQAENNQSLKFDRFVTPPGVYKITTTLTPKDEFKNLGQIPSFDCFFEIRALNPLVVIQGGPDRVVPNDTEIVVSGADSIDPNTPLGENVLQFEWACTKLKSKDPCAPKANSTGKEFRIPAEEAIDEEIFEVQVTVTTQFQTSSHNRQTIEVAKNAALLRISCEKNCPPKTDSPNVQDVTFLRAICEKNCKDIKDDDYAWEINQYWPVYGSFSFDYNTQTHFGRIGLKFIIKKNELKEGYFYNIELHLRPKAKRYGSTSITLKYASAPLIERCDTTPNIGLSLTTKFRFSCVQESPDNTFFYELYYSDEKTGSAGNLIISGLYPDVFNYQFLLPPSIGHQFYVKVSKSGGPVTYKQLYPNVVSVTDRKTGPEVVEIYKKFYEGSEKSISKMVGSNNAKERSEGAEKFQALVEQIISKKIESNDAKSFIKNLTVEVVRDALRSRAGDVNDLLTISDSITKLINQHEVTLLSPVIAKMTTTICKKMIDKHAEAIETNNQALTSKDQMELIQTSLTKCLEAAVNEDYWALEPLNRSITIKELPAVPLEAYIVENYPDYVDQDKHYTEQMENFNTITNNVVQATAKAAKALAMTMVAGQHVSRSFGQSSATVVAKDAGKYIPHTKINLLNVTLIPSKDFHNIDHDFDLLMSVWTKDLMWWNHAKTRPATSIVSVQFWHASCKKRIRHFLNYVELQLKVTKDFKTQLKPGNVTVPDNYLELEGDQLNKYIRVRRVGFPKHSTLYFDFFNMSDENALDVVFTQFEFPTIDHFRKNMTIDRDNMTSMKITNHNSYDVWAYIGVLPNRRVVENGTTSKILHYNLTLVSSFCIRWVKEDRTWQLDCKIGEESTRHDRIICQCKHFSVISGYFQNLNSIVQEVVTIQVVLVLQSCYIIFFTVAVTYAIFCCFFFLTMFKTYKQVFYLADNVIDDLYAYLIIVRTENVHHAGTTSKITIRLKGDKRISEPHVLNYPDPKLRLLQNQSEDIFVLTTNRHLGVIKEIELWFDCSGFNPSWYCRDIVIYDMQKRIQVYFKVKTRFAVDRKGVNYLCIGPREEKGKVTNHIRICNHFHTWMLWAGETNFSYETRLTVVFSNILMIYMFVLLFLGTPTLTLKDCLDRFEEFIFNFDLLILAMQCAFLSFLVHIPLAWTFRFSQIEFKIFDTVYHKSHRYSNYCRTLLCIFVISSTSFLIIYGFWVPVNSSLVWLVTSLVACLFSIVVIENVFIIIQTSICKFKLRVSFDKKFNAILRNIEKQRLFLYGRFNESLFRPLLQHLYAPLKAGQLLRRRIVVELRKSIYEDLQDLFMYSLYNFILYMFILVYHGTLTTVSKSEIESMVQGEHTRTLKFSDIESIPDVYRYINTTLIQIIHPTIWYTNFTIPPSGIMIDNANKVIGVARIRQHRIAANACEVPAQMNFLNMSCQPEFSFQDAETGDFLPKWAISVTGVEYDRLKKIWKYATQSETETWGTVGWIGTYSGGGYVAFLGRTLRNSYANFKKIFDMSWIDHQTRSIFIEFLTYNANYNVFVAVNLLFEQSATGYTSKILQINVVRMLYTQNEVEIESMVYFVLFLFWVSMLNIKLLFGIAKNLTDFYKKFWLMLDVVINFMSLLSISMFILRIKMVQRYLTSLEAVKHNDFISYFNMMYLEEFLTYFVAVLVCFATARLWKFLRFGQFFRIMERTLAMAAVPLGAVTFAFGVIITAFAFVGIIIFNNEFVDLSFFVKIVATLIQLSLKPDQFDLMKFITFKLAYVYFSLYLIIMQVILLVYITVIIMAYVKARLELSCVPDRYTVKDYVKEHSEYIPIFVKSLIARLRAGGSEEPPLTPKADEFRYANCVGVAKNRLKSMRFIVSCIFRNMKEKEEDQRVLTDHETTLMLGVCNTFVLKSSEDDEQELFFKGHFEGQNIQLVDEKRIDKIAAFVDIMFEDRPEFGHIAATDSEKTLIDCCKLAKRQNETLRKCTLLLKLVEFKMGDVDRLVNGFVEDVRRSS
ncbi:uncharacterized protein LOC107397705 [Tribolium castaneum]|uniref:PLAT domain-containing protein n=1 Tax=Tribolium castaneum TaxID=7070 RepID=A0A139WJR2_TRICA|nr:PREDICTED: uncharacterized protein LOC107397705 [Tribolium castaneum]KYB28219.1 hypothetical protein TcasGA2_TC032682 [Tribolium castaneum]|eukprot:XP_015834266.1 PREDICTED: uncharacterized protein LOC107397705 [Tribolium castaneum]